MTAQPVDESRGAGPPSHIARSGSRWRFAKFAFSLIGTLLAGWGGGIGGDLLATDQTPEWKAVLLIGGLLLIFVAALLSFLDGDPNAVSELTTKLETQRSRNETLELAEVQMRSHAQALDAECRAAVARVQLKASLDQVMLQAVETASLDGCKVPASIQMLLDVATTNLLQAMRVGRNEDWTISVFQRKPKGRADAMVRIAQLWANTTDTTKDRRFWRKGEGYTGAAWFRRKAVVLSDAQSADAIKDFGVPKNKLIVENDPSGVKTPDSQRYRSVAAFPIRVGAADPRRDDWEPWGILIVTTDRVDLFSNDDKTPAGENREVVRYLAALVALIVAGSKEFTARGL